MAFDRFASKAKTMCANPCRCSAQRCVRPLAQALSRPPRHASACTSQQRPRTQRSPMPGRSSCCMRWVPLLARRSDLLTAAVGPAQRLPRALLAACSITTAGVITILPAPVTRASVCTCDPASWRLASTRVFCIHTGAGPAGGQSSGPGRL